MFDTSQSANADVNLVNHVGDKGTPDPYRGMWLSLAAARGQATKPHSTSPAF